MTFFINSIGSFLKRIRSVGEDNKNNSIRSPIRDWFILLTATGIALAGIVVWNAWTFNTIVRGGVIGTATTSLQTVFDRSSLNEIQKIFSSRAEEEMKYRTGVYRYADPSQ